jgi:hypothetical protein
MVPLATTHSRRLYMSKRALEFVETWVQEKIEEAGIPGEGEQSPAKEWAEECIKAADEEEGIPALEINEAFDNLAEFIDGEIDEERDREEHEEEEDEDEDDEEFEDDDENDEKED